MKISFNNESLKQWIDRDTLFFNNEEIKYNNLVIPINEIIDFNISMCSVLYEITLLRVFLNYYIDIDVRTDHDVYSFQILNNSQVVKMFDYLQKKQIRLNDRYGLIELYRTKDPVALNKYLCGKFARAMLGVLKVTQDNKKMVWKYIPLQDFTDKSDIDWSVSIANIDKQLYKKYRLSEEEIAFIENNVKEME